MDSSITAILLLGVSFASLLLAWWVGGRVAGRMLISAGPKSLRRALMRRLEHSAVTPCLMTLGALLRLSLLAVVCRLIPEVLKANEITADYWVSLKIKTYGLTHSPTVIIIFDILVIFAGAWMLFSLLRFTKRYFDKARERLATRSKAGRSSRRRIMGASVVRGMDGLFSILLQIVGILVGILWVLVYASIVFSLFPVTRDHVLSGLRLTGAAITRVMDSFWAYLPNLANLAVIALVTWLAIKALKFIAREIRQGDIVIPGFYPEWATPTYQLAKVLTLALALVVAFPFLPGSDSPIFHGMSVFFGVLISLGSTSFIANVVAGVVLTYTRGFRIGDRVRIADTQGDIVEKGLLVTRVRTIKNVEVTIPNSLVMSSHMINYSTVSRDRHLILCTTVTLSYDLPWRMVHETLVRAALSSPGILAHPKPFVMQTSLNDYHVSYELNAYTDEPNRMHLLYSNLHQNIQDACNAAGFEILSPGYTAVRDGNGSTIPAEHRPAGHAEGAFKVRILPPGEAPNSGR